MVTYCYVTMAMKSTSCFLDTGACQLLSMWIDPTNGKDVKGNAKYYSSMFLRKAHGWYLSSGLSEHEAAMGHTQPRGLVVWGGGAC
jgi:hypothetical protein